MLTFINAIRANQSEKQIINKLQSMKVGLQSTIEICPEVTTPLAEAAMRGYFDVVKYLIETKKVNPHESYAKDSYNLAGKNMMALEAAIFGMKLADKNTKKFHNLTKVALYLINIMENFSITDKNFCMPLYYAITFDYLEVVQALLKRKPSLLQATDSDRRTMLHVATSCHDSDKDTRVIEYLLEKVDGKPRNDLNAYDINQETPYFHVLFHLKSKLLRLMLDNGAYPLSLYYNFEIVSPLLAVCETDIPGAKNRCINMLLAAGAGLEISKVPKDVLEKYIKDENRRSQAEILLMVNGGLITTLDEMRLYLKKNKQGFEIDNLVNAVKDPVALSGKHNKALRKILSVNETDVIEPIDIPKHPFKSITKEEIPKLSKTTLAVHTSKNYALLMKLRNLIEKGMNDGAEDAALVHIEQYLKVLSTVIALAQHNDFSKVMISATYNIDESMNVEFSKFFKIVLEHINSHKVKSLCFTHLNKIIKQYAKAFRNHTASFYSYMVAKTIAVGISLAFDALNDYKDLFALTLLLNLNKILSPDFEKINSLKGEIVYKYSQESQNAQKICQLLLLSKTYIRLELYQNAEHCLLECLPIVKNSQNSPFLVETTSISTIQVIAEMDKAKNLSYRWKLLLQKHCNDILLNFTRGASDNSKLVECNIALEVAKDTLNSLEKLKSFGLINKAFCIDKEIYRYCENELKALFSKNTQIKMDFVNAEIYFTEQFMLSHHNFLVFDALLAILQKAKMDCTQNAQIVKVMLPQFSALTIGESKEKVKTRKESTWQVEESITVDEKIEDTNYGFTQREGFSPAVPITCNAMPSNTFFLSMRTDDKAFTPFLGLIRQNDNNNNNNNNDNDNDNYQYFPIRRIPEKGLNQQGVKISAKWEKDENKQLKECFIARVKIINSQLRAYGRVVEEQDGKKLFLIDETTTKKEEQRLKYNKK